METLQLSSPAFQQGFPIPKRYTGFGEDVSPALRLSGLAPDTVSLAVIMDDLDVPFIKKPYHHWLIWNLPPLEELPEGIPPGQTLPGLGGAVQGIGYGMHCYRGPRPPVFLRMPHRYVFRVFSLDCRLNLPPQTGGKRLLAAMAGHILQEASLFGTFQR